MPLPPRYRNAFREGIVLSQGSPDQCIRLYTQGAFEEQARQYTAQTSMRRKGRDLRKMLFSTSHHAQLDAQNRLLIPGALREFAGLSGKVLLVGTGEWLELWAPETYESEMSRIEDQLEATLESIEDR